MLGVEVVIDLDIDLLGIGVRIGGLLRGAAGGAFCSAQKTILRDIQAVQKGMEYSARQLFEEMKTFDFDALGYSFDLPFFVLQGEGDILTPAASAKAYVAHIHAPQKAFVPLKDAGHLAEFCHPHQFLQELVKYVLPQVR